jgi:hypothetical protein
MHFETALFDLARHKLAKFHTLDFAVCGLGERVYELNLPRIFVESLPALHELLKFLSEFLIGRQASLLHDERMRLYKICLVEPGPPPEPPDGQLARTRPHQANPVARNLEHIVAPSAVRKLPSESRHPLSPG